MMTTETTHFVNDKAYYLGGYKIFKGTASSIGWITGTKKTRIELSNKTKRFSVALFQSNEVLLEDKNKKWVALCLPYVDSVICADISSLSKRLWMPEQSIITSADLDLLNINHSKIYGQGFLEGKIKKYIETYFLLRKFVYNVLTGNLNNIINNHDINIIIDGHLGKLDPDSDEKSIKLIEEFDASQEKANNHLMELCSVLKDNPENEKSLNQVSKFLLDTKEFKNLKLSFKKLEPDLQPIKNTLIEKNSQSPENFQEHLNDFFLKLDSLNIDDLIEKKEKINKDFKQKFNLDIQIAALNTKIKRSLEDNSIKIAWDFFIERNLKYPGNTKKYLNEFIGKLKEIDEAFFLKKEPSILEYDDDIIQIEEIKNLQNDVKKFIKEKNINDSLNLENSFIDYEKQFVFQGYQVPEGFVDLY